MENRAGEGLIPEPRQADFSECKIMTFLRLLEVFVNVFRYGSIS